MQTVLFLGDIVGRPGRTFVRQRLPELRAQWEVNCVIANAENAAGGAGLTAKISEELLTSGVDAITLGDHVWDQRNFENEIHTLECVCRPANLPNNNPGRIYLVIENEGFRLGVATVLGRNFMGIKADACPFKTSDNLLKVLKEQENCDAVFIEAHMEATSEKIALGWHLDGRAAAVIGTHTHVPTADGRILPRGTAYLSDAGMCGSYASVLGREIEPVTASFLDGMKRRFPVAKGDVRIAGALIQIDPLTGLASSFERVEISDGI
ncbi:MAG: Uncharacterised protein [Opitutia bacterium UBA7350]|nr:MAG: Uncharacterised protein [Opitutae bacterium UBA7350]